MKISAEEYEATPEFFGYMQGKSSMLNLTAEFYTDVFGRIAHIESNDASSVQRFGYLTKIIPKDEGEVTNHLIKVFTEDGIFETLTLSDNVSVDNKKSVSSMSAGDWFAENGSVQQLISYKTNSENEVTLIETADDEPRDGLYKMCDIADKRFRSTYKSFGSAAILGDDTVVFCVPSDSADYQNETCYSVGNYSAFSNGVTYNNVAVYGMDEETYTADAVVYKEGNAGTWQNNFFVIDSVELGVNREGEIVSQVYGWTVDGEMIGYNSISSLDFDTVTTPFTGGTLPAEEGVALGKGDIVQIARNSRNEISRYRLIYSYEYDYWCPASNPYFASNSEEYRLGIGEPVGLDGTILKVRYESGGDEYFDIVSAKVLIVSGGGKKAYINESSAAELVNGEISKVFVYAPSNSPKIVFAYER